MAYHLSISTKIIGGFLLVAFVPLGIVSIMGFTTVQETLEEVVIAELETVAVRKAALLTTRIQELEADLVSAQTYVNVKINLPLITRIADPLDPRYIEARRAIHGQLGTLREGKGFADILLVNLDGGVVYRASGSPTGALPVFLEDAFSRGREGVAFGEVVSRDEGAGGGEGVVPEVSVTMLGAAPVRDFTGVLAGVIIFDFGMERLYAVTQEDTGLGETGETMLGALKGASAVLLNPLRHDPHAALQRMLIFGTREAHAMEEALAGRNGFAISEDYRAQPVVAAWRYLPTMNWGIVVKMDSREAFAAAVALKRDLVFLYGVLFVSVLLLASAFARSIAAPVIALRNTALKLKAGNLEQRVSVKGSDEIGELGLAFNAMAAQLKDSYARLEEKVRIRTEELEDERDRVSREKEKTEAILQSIGDGVFVVDRDQRVTMCNQVAAQLAGVDMGDVIGKRRDAVFQFALKSGKMLPNGFIELAMQKGEIRQMPKGSSLVRADGRRIPVADNAAPLMDENGVVVGCVVVFRDVTQEREVDKAKSEFVALASHQLRTPLAIMKWHVGTLLRNGASQTRGKQRYYLEKVRDANDRMVALMNALLNVSRIELGTLAVHPEPTDLAVLAESVLQDLAPEIHDKRLRVETQYDKKLQKINVDPQLLRIVLQNLLSNAVKYTPEGEEVRLSIVGEDQNVVITVADNGYGIPKDQQKKIFTKLFRADNVRQYDTDGTGLGLYIVKSVVETSGGKIWFTSEENKGTTFFVTFPLSGMRKVEGTTGFTT